MGSRVLFFSVAGLFITSFAHAEPYRLVIYADPGAIEEAMKFKEELRSTPPFNRLGKQFEVWVRPASNEDLSCQPGKKIERLPTCSKTYVTVASMTDGADKAAIMTSAVSYGGAGGNVPIASDGKILLHELMHTWGFGDEYTYSEGEASIYCNGLRRWLKDYVNVACFESVPPYASDKVAKNVHHDDISWSGSIKTAVLITNGSNLGTLPGIFPNEEAALYSSEVCINYEKACWKPYQQATIMENSQNGDLPAFYQEYILRAMAAERGEPFVLLPDTAETETARSATNPSKPGSGGGTASVERRGTHSAPVK